MILQHGSHTVINEAAALRHFWPTPLHNFHATDTPQRLHQSGGRIHTARRHHHPHRNLRVRNTLKPLGNPLQPATTRTTSNHLNLWPPRSLRPTNRDPRRRPINRHVHRIRQFRTIHNLASEIRARLPRPTRKRTLQRPKNPLTQTLSAEHRVRVRRTRRRQRLLRQRTVTHSRIRFRPPVTIPLRPTRSSRPLKNTERRIIYRLILDALHYDWHIVRVDPVRVTQRGMRLLPQRHEHDRQLVASIRQSPRLRLRTRHHCLSDRAPSLPVRVLTQLVQQQQI